jgi:molecular chaperone DnaK (HSP70)
VSAFTDERQENHMQTKTRMLKMNEEQYDLGKMWAGTDDEQKEHISLFKQKYHDIINDTQYSSRELVVSHGLEDKHGLISLQMNHWLSKKEIAQKRSQEVAEERDAKKQKKEMESAEKKEAQEVVRKENQAQKQKDKQSKARTKNMLKECKQSWRST